MRKSLVGRVILTAALVSFVFSVIPSATAEEMEWDFWSRIQKSGVLNFGTAPAPPDSYKDPKTGEWKGVVIEIAQRIADEVGVKLEVHGTTWDYIIAGLHAKKWDIAGGLNYTAKRSLSINYTEPYRFVTGSIVYRKDSAKIKEPPTSLQDLDREEITFATVAGSADYLVLKRKIKNAKTLILPADEEMFMAVLSGRADAVMADNETLLVFYNTYPNELEYVEPTSPYVFRQPAGFGFRNTVPMREIEVANVVIRIAKEMGEIDYWNEHHREEARKR